MYLDKKLKIESVLCVKGLKNCFQINIKDGKVM